MATKRLREEDESTDGDAPTVMPPKAKRQKGIAAAAAASHVVLSRCRQSLTRAAVSRLARRVVLQFEKLYLDRLPCADMYEWSFMHRDRVTHILVIPSRYES